MSPVSAASSSLASASRRLKSLDVFRGAIIAAMILVNGQFGPEESYRQLAHAAWNGWTFADTIYPCFLFIVGVSLILSTASRVARGEDRSRLLWHAPAKVAADLRMRRGDRLELLRSKRHPRQQVLLILGGGIVLIASGELLSTWVPINKQLWTISFAVFMAGLAATSLACSHLARR